MSFNIFTNIYHECVSVYFILFIIIELFTVILFIVIEWTCVQVLAAEGEHREARA